MSTRCHHLFERIELSHPFHRYVEAYRAEGPAFLLDSALRGEPQGRASFVGGNPFVIYQARRRPDRDADITVGHRDGETESRVAAPFEDLRATMNRYAVDPATHAATEVPLLSGAVGYFGYEAGHFIERLPEAGGAATPDLPDIYLMFVDTLLAQDHRTGDTWLSVIGRGATDDEAAGNAVHLRDAELERIASFERRVGARSRPDAALPPATADDSLPTPGDTPLVEADFDRQAYERQVARAQQHILDGDVFEVCFTQRMQADFQGDGWNLYQALRETNPAPFASYLRLPEAEIISSSPERFLRVGPDRVVESRPIKGTRPRGQTESEDSHLYESLLTSEKDRAENAMIVDLTRNDLGRVCKFHSVHVPEMQVVERFATVFQMVSTVRGELRDDCHPIDLIAACFPGGSMTGAPKIEAMKIISALERRARGVYAGCLGYLDFSGPLDLAIVIRTLVLAEGRCTWNTGGAIVADSEAQAEYEEMQDKARALIDALAAVGTGR